MSLASGTTIGSYRVTAKIGEGGMGEVYRARDTKLDRDVALKVLPPAFTDDPDRLVRFEREAKVLASLNHPGIAGIHGLEEQDVTKALVLELVEGPTLADRIAQGPIPVDEALPIAKQIAEALEAAHEQGIIHRDLKPANIKVRPDGTVKVLDFGLAKALDTAPEGDPNQSPTLTAASTQMGVIMGTAAYMSPEQAAGKLTDKRSDIWSFGVVLFEMLTGDQLFAGETVSHTLAKVLEREPDWNQLPKGVSAPTRHLMRRCLERQSRRRLRDIGEARVALEDSSSVPADSPDAASRQRSPVPWALGAFAAGAVAAVWLTATTRTPIDLSATVTHFNVEVEGGIEMLASEYPEFALSSDGRALAYVPARSRDGQLASSDQLIHLRRFDELDTMTLTGTEGASGPFFSPDGQSVGFVQNQVLMRVSVDGGPATEIVGSRVGDGAGASWGPDDAIVYAPLNSKVLWRISASGGEAEQITEFRDAVAEAYHSWPQVLNDGRQVLYTIVGPSGMWVDSQIVIEDLDTGERTTLVEQATHGRYFDGYLVYATATGTLYAVPLDPRTWQIESSAVPVMADVQLGSYNGAAAFAVSRAGVAALVHGSHPNRASLEWVDRSGAVILKVGEPQNALPYLNLSPDGSRIATNIHTEDSVDLWLLDADTGDGDRFTFNVAADFTPAWSPNGGGLAYVSTREDGGFGIFVQGVAGGRRTEVYAAPELAEFWVFSWSGAGDWIAFVEAQEGSKNIRAVQVESPENVLTVSATAANEWFPQFSPNGRWLAYESDETGRPEVYVVSFPDLGVKQQVSSGGGEAPRWSRDSGELFFWAPSGTLMVAQVSTGDVFTRTTPQPLFAANVERRDRYDVAADGQRFLLSVRNPEPWATTIHVIQNWSHQFEPPGGDG